jgi:peptidoglycan/LPS O-acetylase OafA/YrhL
MKSENGVYSVFKTISIIAGSIALIGIVVGLYYQILPESNSVIRFAEIGFFSLCIPVLLGEAWQNLKTMKCTLLHLKVFLGMISFGLLLLLYLANQSGGILTYEFMAVVVLTIMIIVLVAVGAEPINRMLFRTRPVGNKR